MKTFLEMIAIGFPYEVRAVSFMFENRPWKHSNPHSNPTPFWGLSLSLLVAGRFCLLGLGFRYGHGRHGIFGYSSDSGGGGGTVLLF